MSLTIVTPPTGYVLTIAEVRRQLLQQPGVGEAIPPAPTVALASPAVAGNVDNGDHRYVVTFVTADGETSAGDISGIVTVADKTVNGKVELTNLAIGGTNVTSRKLYRTAAGGTSYLLLATIANNTATTYTDNVADSALGAEVPTTNTTEDPEVQRWIESSERNGQRISRRAFRTQTWDLVLDAFPDDDFVELPKPPLQSITHLKYRDTAGTLQTWAATNYIVEAPAGDYCAHGRLSLAYGISWPTLYGQRGDVQVRFVCGYGATSAVPKILKDAMLLEIGSRAAWRESVSRESVQLVPGTSADIYKSFRAWSIQRRAA